MTQLGNFLDHFYLQNCASPNALWGGGGLDQVHFSRIFLTFNVKIMSKNWKRMIKQWWEKKRSPHLGGGGGGAEFWVSWTKSIQMFLVFLNFPYWLGLLDGCGGQGPGTSFFAVTHTWTQDKPTTSAGPAETQWQFLPWPPEVPWLDLARCSVYNELKMECYRYSLYSWLWNCDWFVIICNHLWQRQQRWL